MEKKFTAMEKKKSIFPPVHTAVSRNGAAGGKKIGIKTDTGHFEHVFLSQF